VPSILDTFCLEFIKIYNPKTTASYYGCFIFVLFSYSQIINQSNNIILSESTDKNIHLDIISPEESLEKKDYDFQIATLLREEYPSNEIALTLNNTALVATNNEVNQNIIPTRTEIETYVVKPNDNPWDIAEKIRLKCLDCALGK